MSAHPLYPHYPLPIAVNQCCVFEQAGRLIHAKVVSLSSKNIRLNTGKKIARDHVWLVFDEGLLKITLQTVEQWRKIINIKELWQAAAAQNLTLIELTAMVAKGNTNAGVQWAVLECIIDNPAYFRRFNQLICPVDEAILQKALSSIDARQRLLNVERQLLAQLQNGEVPALIGQDMIPMLCQTNKTAPTYQALKKFIGADKERFAQFFIDAGLLCDIGAYWKILFENEWRYSEKDNLASYYCPPLPDLPQSDALAFSIDDDGTFEVDDAFSVKLIDKAQLLIGVHIAAPALLNNNTVVELARMRQTSVYSPDKKYPMLPLSIIEKFSLATTHYRPAISLYVLFNTDSQTWKIKQTVVELIKLHCSVTPTEVEDNKIPPVIKTAFQQLSEFSEVLIAEKPLPSIDRSRNFKIDMDKMIVRRRDKSHVNNVVESLMRFVNTQWGEKISQANIGGLYRYNGYTLAKYPSTSDTVPYMWVSSPLRRFVDLINQKLLLSLLSDSEPCHEDWKQLAKRYELKRASARAFQQMMESHWAMSILSQQAKPIIEAVDVTRRGQIRLKNYPIAVQAATPLLDDSPAVRLQINSLDFFKQQVGGEWV